MIIYYLHNKLRPLTTALKTLPYLLACFGAKSAITSPNGHSQEES